MSDDGPEWFAPKRYGFGSGMPISWQGWAVTLGFIAIGLLLKEVTVAKVMAMKPSVTAQPCQLIGTPEPNPYRLGANHSGPSSLISTLPWAAVRASWARVLAA